MKTVRPRATMTVSAEDAGRRAGSIDPQHVLEHVAVVAGEAGDHGVGVAARHHAGAEDVAVLVDQALAVAEQQAVALLAVVEVLGVLAVVLRQAGVVDLDALGARRGPCPAWSGARAPRARSGSACRCRCCARRARREMHLLLLALGEHDAARVGAHAVDDQLHPAGRRVEPASAARGGSSSRLDDRLARATPLSIAALATAAGTARDQARVERRRDEVFRPVAQPAAAVGGGDLVRHLLARQRRDAPRRRRSSSRR